MNSVDQHLRALGFFKDWSNYLLVTTVAGLGWVATKTSDAAVSANFARAVVCLLGLSAVFAMFTLALIPLIAEKITTNTTSFYDERAPFRLFWMWGPSISLPLKAVCWPQHVFFIVGVLIFAVGALVK